MRLWEEKLSGGKQYIWQRVFPMWHRWSKELCPSVLGGFGISTDGEEEPRKTACALYNVIRPSHTQELASKGT